MGKRERQEFRQELEKLNAIPGPGETEEYYAQNAKTWEAEKKVGLLENLWVRGQVG